jgi:hypothetical protein
VETVFEVAGRLREAARGSGLAAFASCEEPAEWEWLPPGHERIGVALPEERDGSLIAELVRAVSEDDAALMVAGGGEPERDWLDPVVLAGLIADRLPAAPSHRSPVTATEPEWVYLVPASRPWEIPVAVHAPCVPNWRGSAAHPDLLIADHVAVLRSWYRRFGAEICYLSTNDMELTVGRPPAAAEEVAAVAVEQWGYCQDLDQVPARLGDPERVALRQVVSDRWYFWWD